MRPLGLIDGVEHHPVRDLLFVEENELLPVADLVGGHRYELLGRDGLTREQFVCRDGAGMLVAQLGAEVVEERAALLRGEEAAAVVRLDRTQARRTELGGVVKVGDTRDASGVGRERAVEVDKVLAAYLLDRVEDGVCVSADAAQGRIVLVWFGLAPLLEFDHHVRRFACRGVDAGEDDIRALAVERQRVLDQHLDVTQAGLVEGVDQGGMLRSQERASEALGR